MLQKISILTIRCHYFKRMKISYFFLSTIIYISIIIKCFKLFQMPLLCLCSVTLIFSPLRYQEEPQEIFLFQGSQSRNWKYRAKVFGFRQCISEVLNGLHFRFHCNLSKKTFDKL